MSDSPPQDPVDLEDILRRYDRAITDAQEAREGQENARNTFLTSFRKVRETVIVPRMEIIAAKLNASGHDAQIEITDRQGMLGPDPTAALHINPRNYDLLMPHEKAASECRFSAEPTIREVLFHQSLPGSYSSYQRVGIERITNMFLDAKLFQFVKDVFQKRW